jgi:hypothetical protein
MKDDELAAVLAKHDTIITATIRKIAIDRRGAPLRNWIVVMDVDEVLRGAPLGPSVYVFVHSPTHEFPMLDEPDRIGAKTIWAFARDGDAIRSAVHLTTLAKFESTLAQVHALIGTHDDHRS